MVPRAVILRATLTLLWLAALAVFFRWWEAKLDYPALLLWTLVFTGVFLAAALARFGRGLRERRREVWRPVALWLGLVALAAAVQAAVPTFTVRERDVPTAVVLDALDAVFALWIAGRGLGLLWDPPLRWLVLGGAVALLALGALWFMMGMPGRAHAGPLDALTAEARGVQANLERRVRALAGEIGERNESRPRALAEAAVYVERELHALGYEVASLPFETAGQTFRNVEVTLPGVGRPEEIVVVGGHYDTAPGVPGADDNASGVAAVLECARLLRGASLGRTVRLVFFPNEEPPFFYTEGMGSREYVRRAQARRERIVAMISVESIGYYATEPGSQQYPFPFNLFYPDRGDFIAFVGNFASRGLVRRSIGAFRRAARFPSEGAAAPEWIPGILWSDHSSFWRAGYRAIMITDTAPFRYPYYHTAEDTPEKLDYERMARVVVGLAAVVRELARAS